MFALLLVAGLLAGTAAAAAAEGSPDSGVIRLRPSQPQPSSETPDASAVLDRETIRRGFDYGGFQSRFESLWFQRKVLLRDGRAADAQGNAELMRAFCREEGVHKLELTAGALVLEATRFVDEGRHERALESLSLAAAFDRGRPQTHLLRAMTYWRAGEGFLATAGELAAAVKGALVRSVRDLSLFSELGLVLVLAVLLCLGAFAVLIVVRHQLTFRHEVEEWLGPVLTERWARWAGWFLLGIPLVTWVGAGWAALYWIVVLFRFMNRSERVVAVALVLAALLALPAFHMAVTMYGMTADPVVRTTLASAEGEYSPDRVIDLQRLVDLYPRDPTFRFLLAGLFKTGRYFEDALAEYQAALELDPGLEEAHVNIGNLYYMTGQYREATAAYHRALEVDPDDLLALFNAHLSQSEEFRFAAAEKSLLRARVLGEREVNSLLEQTRREGSRPIPLDAALQTTSIWAAALEGRTPAEALQATEASAGFESLADDLFAPLPIVAVLVLLACGFAALSAWRQQPAQRCIRCGGAFCQWCKSTRGGHEYCSQCYHLYVLGDGLAPDAKSHKVYEVAAHERRSRRLRGWLSLLVPGAGHVLRGRAISGVLLLTCWLAALISADPRVLWPLERISGLTLRFDLLRAVVPSTYDPDPRVLLAGVALIAVWTVANVGRRRGREV